MQLTWPGNLVIDPFFESSTYTSNISLANSFWTFTGLSSAFAFLFQSSSAPNLQGLLYSAPSTGLLSATSGAFSVAPGATYNISAFINGNQGDFVLEIIDANTQMVLGTGNFTNLIDTGNLNPMIDNVNFHTLTSNQVLASTYQANFNVSIPNTTYKISIVLSQVQSFSTGYMAFYFPSVSLLLPAKNVSPILQNINSGCPGQQVVVTGQFLPADSKVYFVGTNEILPTVASPTSADGVNYSMKVIIPIRLSTQTATYQVYIKSESLKTTSNQITLTIPNNCALPTLPKLTITPTNPLVPINTTQSFKAIILNSQNNSTPIDVTNQVFWYINGTFNGGGSVGSISNNGLYTAPSTSPLLSPLLQATFVYQNIPLYATNTITVASTANVLQSHDLTTPEYKIEYKDLDEKATFTYLLTVSPNQAIINTPGTQLQFFANLSFNGGPNTPVVAQTWSVNGIIGGNTKYGTITPGGLYNAPTTYIPNDLMNVEVVATFTALTPSNNLVPLVGYSVITYLQVLPQTNSCEVSVLQQVNIFFGDGRHGYIPSGTTFNLLPGQYLLATYSETLNSNYLPQNIGPSQLLAFSTDSAGANDLPVSVYNEGTITPLSSPIFPSQVYSKPYTFILGLCDPTTGQFQSMWDFIKVLSPVKDPIPVQPSTPVIAHSMAGDSIDTETDIATYTESKMKNFVLPNTTAFETKNLSLWTGNILVQKNQIKIDDLKLISVNDNILTVLFNFTNKNNTIKMKDNQLLIALKTKTSFEIKALNLGTIKDWTESYILGFFSGKFYSRWPLLNVASENLLERFENFGAFK